MATNPTAPGQVTAGDYITETWGDRTDTYLAHAGANRPRVSAIKSSNKNISSGSATALDLDSSEDFDTDSFHSLVTNSSRITIPASTGGTYLIVGMAACSGTPTSGTLTIGWRANAGTINYRASVPFTTGNNMYVCFSDLATLAAADYIELIILQSSGSAQDFIGNLKAIQVGWT